MAVALTLMLGGGNTSAPLAEMALECALAGVALAWLWVVPTSRIGQVPARIWLISGLVLALPLAQLIPLPPAMWHALPGRELEIQALHLVSADQQWRPLSLTPARSLASLLAMAGAALIFVMVASLPREGRTIVLATIVLVGALSMVVGAAQLSNEGDNPYRFYHTGVGYLVGFQASHAAEADVLLIAAVALAAVGRDIAELQGHGISKFLLLGSVGGGTALFLLGVVLTASRAGILLIPVALLAQAIILRPWLRIGWRPLAVTGIVALLLVAGLGVYLWHNAALDAALGRFRAHGDFRPKIWSDSLYAAHLYFPWGAGMGSFVPVFAAIERLEIVGDRFINRAHDDYLEFLIESGLPGVLLLLLVLQQLASAIWRGVVHGTRKAFGQFFCAISGLVIIALHSLIDFPFRTMAVAGVVASAAAILLAPPTFREFHGGPKDPA